MNRRPENSDSGQPLRPRGLALLLLASADLLPRQRARDQQADVAGLKLKRCLLDHVVALDPEPEQFEASLLRIVEKIGSPTGPTRALAVAFREEWQAACLSPEWVGHLLEEAINETAEERQHERRVRP